MKLGRIGLENIEDWKNAGVVLPGYDITAVTERTIADPKWIHFGSGNIFRGYIAVIADDLLQNAYSDTGIIAVASNTSDIIDKVCKPCDNLVLSVKLFADGRREKRIVGSISQTLSLDDYEKLQEIFRKDSLQMVSLTITEKGYDGSIITELTKLLYERYKKGYAIALVSMDNFRDNGDVLKKAVLRETEKINFPDKAGFVDYINQKISFPFTMIDKITPRPSEEIAAALAANGISGMDITVTTGGTYIAPFVNSEAAEYLVIEDNFPNGRPALEKPGVYLTDRKTVALVDQMKVTACLNPMHTALAVFGCLLGYTAIYEMMKDRELSALVRKIGYDEGLPVVVSPGIINPRTFIDEVINERLPNPFIPDTPQRIASDTSKKIPIRFGNTIKEYQKLGRTNELTGIPLAIAAWLRYLDGIDDQHKSFELSPDPRLDELRKMTPEQILKDTSIFDTDLSDGGLDKRILDYYNEMREPGGVRACLAKEVTK